METDTNTSVIDWPRTQVTTLMSVVRFTDVMQIAAIARRTPSPYRNEFLRLRADGKAHGIEEVGARLREIMPWVDRPITARPGFATLSRSVADDNVPYRVKARK